MNKKIFGILVMTLLISTSTIAIGINQNQNDEVNPINSFRNSVELIDQNSPSDDIYRLWFDTVDPEFIQSFVPEHSPFSKIKLTYGSMGNPPRTNFTIDIKETFDGEAIASSIIDSNDIDSAAVEFNFPDTDLNVGMTYYMHLSVDVFGGYDDDFHFFRCAINGQYEQGELWTHHQGTNWKPIGEAYGGDWDLGFTTYWRDFSPDNPTIDGPPEGKAQERYAYTFSTDDPEGHDVEYQIDWGDGITTNWLGTYESGEEVEKEHQWAYENNYTIRVRARDIYGAESDWTPMEITMPKPKFFTHPFLWFLESHPNLFPILRLLLT